MQRADAAVEVAVAVSDGATRIDTLFQRGSGKCILPTMPGAVPEAVLINTAGGVTGGDRIRWHCTARDGAELVVTTQAAERIYRSTGPEALITTELRLGRGARLAWLPQETILFDAARLRRRLAVEMAADATLLALEPLILGRRAMGEIVVNAALTDHWRIRRGGRLAYADALRLVPPVTDLLARPGTCGGARALATLVFVAPDAASRLDPARARLAGFEAVEAAASTYNGLLSLRFAAPDFAPLRSALAAILPIFGAVPPRVWSV